MEEKQNNEETTKKIISGGRGKITPRWKPGESGNPAGRPKGSKNFETYFMEAWKEVAEALRLNKDPDRGKVEILKLGFKEMFKGNYQFWRDFTDRLFGKPQESLDITTQGEKIQRINYIIPNDHDPGKNNNNRANS